MYGVTLERGSQRASQRLRDLNTRGDQRLDMVRVSLRRDLVAEVDLGQDLTL